GGARQGPATAHDLARAEPLPLSQVEVDDRPSLTLLARSGDPRPAVAFVARHGHGAVGSAALLGLLTARLEAAGLRGCDARAHGLGVEVSQLVDSEEDLERFFVGVQRALQAPVQRGEPALARARKELAALGALRFAGPAESAVAACSGELGASDGAST